VITEVPVEPEIGVEAAALSVVALMLSVAPVVGATVGARAVVAVVATGVTLALMLVVAVVVDEEVVGVVVLLPQAVSSITKINRKAPNLPKVRFTIFCISSSLFISLSYISSSNNNYTKT
jgi:uncharacterized protein (DUF697 family)